jgi:hypothetical protein
MLHPICLVHHMLVYIIQQREAPKELHECTSLIHEPSQRADFRLYLFTLQNFITEKQLEIRSATDN